MILTRISSKKFATLFIEKLKLANPPKACSESISNEISTKSNFSNDEDEVNSLHSATISEMGTFTIRRSLILDEKNFFLETGRKWIQHIYDSVDRIIKRSGRTGQTFEIFQKKFRAGAGQTYFKKIFQK